MPAWILPAVGGALVPVDPAAVDPNAQPVGTTDNGEPVYTEEGGGVGGSALWGLGVVGTEPMSNIGGAAPSQWAPTQPAPQDAAPVGPDPNLVPPDMAVNAPGTVPVGAPLLPSPTGTLPASTGTTGGSYDSGYTSGGYTSGGRSSGGSSGGGYTGASYGGSGAPGNPFAALQGITFPNGRTWGQPPPWAGQPSSGNHANVSVAGGASIVNGQPKPAASPSHGYTNGAGVPPKVTPSGGSSSGGNPMLDAIRSKIMGKMGGMMGGGTSSSGSSSGSYSGSSSRSASSATAPAPADPYGTVTGSSVAAAGVKARDATERLTGFARHAGYNGAALTNSIYSNPEWILPDAVPGLKSTSTAYGMLSDLPANELMMLANGGRKGWTGGVNEQTNGLADLFGDIMTKPRVLDQQKLMGGLFDPKKGSPMSTMFQGMTPQQQSYTLDPYLSAIAGSTMSPDAAQAWMGQADQITDAYGTMSLSRNPTKIPTLVDYMAKRLGR